MKKFIMPLCSFVAWRLCGKSSRLKKLLLAGSLSIVGLRSHAQLQWPATTITTKPWTRWWWEGSAVNKQDLTWNLEQYQKAGLGGVEITPIYGIHGYENEFIDFLSPKWMEMLVHTLNETKRLDMGADMANATGWPFGGPWVTNEDASKTIYYKTYTVNGGEQLKDKIEYKQEAMVRTANNKPASIDTIKEPVWLNKNLQALALDQIQYPGRLPLKALVAYSNNKQVIDITNNVDAAGNLSWIPPAGQWTLYALFEGLHGKMVERGAPGGEGYALDHFSTAAAKDYFKKFDDAFKGYNLTNLRGFFNDSYEVDDARGQANWTQKLFAEFKQRKGYDLRDQLPALFAKASTDLNKRVLYDYRSVIDELILENFTEQWKKWAAAKGKIVRNQSHGSPANTLDLYSVVDIPETEGTDVLRFKFASSAANVSGKKLTSSESATWLNEHFLSSWGDLKKAIDLYFLGGVNHIFYHGTEYSPKDVPWPGWLFYAAVHFQPNNPQWKDFHVLNEYITRVQSFLQQAKPDNDVLLYYPIVDRYSEPGKELLQHFDGMEKNFENTDFEHVSKWMLEHGYTFDFFSERQLAKMTNSGKKILTGGSTYQTILLPANKLISANSFQQLVNLAKNGATVLVYKNLPKDVPGLANLESNQKIFQQLISQLHFTQTGSIKKAVIGKGHFLVADDMESLLKATNIRKETLVEKGLSFERKKNANGTLYFINNRNDKPVEDWISLSAMAASFALYNAMTGVNGLAKTKKNAGGATEILVQLQPFESIIVQTYNTGKIGHTYPYVIIAAEPKEMKSNWTIEFLTGGPTLPANIKTNNLVSWTTLGADDVKNFSGTAKYTTTFYKPADAADSYLLDLGKVHETAEILLNGKKLATLIGPSFKTVIPASMLQQANKLEIIVANLMANRISYMDRNNMPWKIFYNINMPARLKENTKNGLFSAADWKPLPSGLLGPVTITALK